MRVPVVACALLGAAHAAAPIARHFSVVTDASNEAIIQLRGYDADGDRLTYTVEALPARGELVQLSQVFSDYGYEPRYGVPIAEAGVAVTGSRDRVIYRGPAAYQPTERGAWATFDYRVSDAADSSALGRVWVLRASDADSVVVSDFALGDEGWTVDTGARGVAPVAATHDASRRGALNRFIYGVDRHVNVAAAGASDDDRWYFVAPAKFLGNQIASYGGALRMRVASASGDFSEGNLNAGRRLVVLECATCNAHRGRRLAFPAGAAQPVTGADAELAVPLREDAGWLVDPENEIVNAWQPPSACAFAEVLEGLTAVRILGDHTRWYESLALDDVRLTRGGPIPVACYAALG